jgi:hypothetical protein
MHSATSIYPRSNKGYKYMLQPQMPQYYIQMASFLLRVAYAGKYLLKGTKDGSNKRQWDE